MSSSLTKKNSQVSTNRNSELTINNLRNARDRENNNRNVLEAGKTRKELIGKKGLLI